MLTYLSLGANLGDRLRLLREAVALLAEKGVAIRRSSPYYETEPQDVADQPWFINLVIEAETTQTPEQLLATIQEVELALGRVREGAPPRGPRVVDIDILLCQGSFRNTPDLVIPHPRMWGRRFVLEPLAQLSPDPELLGGMDLATALEQTKTQNIRLISGPRVAFSR